jgi:hypothetical protein
MLKNISILILFLLLPSFILAKELVCEYGLVSIKTSKSYSGNIFLASGNISEKDYYIAYVKTDRGICKIKLENYNVYIIETNCSPKLKIIFDTCYSLHKTEEEYFLCKKHLMKSKKIFYIPKDSIISTYKLD